MGINYSEKIPNNVNLADDRALQRALEHWQRRFLEWWQDVGPVESRAHDVYLRTAVSVEPDGWAHFDYVKMPDYRWGIFMNPPLADRTIHFGAHKGERARQDVPGEHRANLRRIIVTQGDTEPASVEQQRHLGLTAPSSHDVSLNQHTFILYHLQNTYFFGQASLGQFLVCQDAGDLKSFSAAC